jgi:hypothetical protein
VIHEEFEDVLQHELVTIPMAMALLRMSHHAIDWMIVKGQLEVVDMSVSVQPQRRTNLVKTASIRKVLEERQTSIQ